MENPPDAFLRYMSVNYPKQPEDEMRIEAFMKQYAENQH